MAFTEKSKEEFLQLSDENKEEIETLMDIVINENKEALEEFAKLWWFKHQKNTSPVLINNRGWIVKSTLLHNN
mgnify:CR=1 FL=1